VTDEQRQLERKYKALEARLDERTLRLWAAVEARSLGRGGISTVAGATGLSRTTIHVGLKDLDSPAATTGPAGPRIRVKGGGRKRLTGKDPRLAADLEKLVSPMTRGDPMSPLRWTCKSTTKLAETLNQKAHRVSQRTLCDLLAEQGYSLQSVRKRLEGSHHPDRDAQFKHIAQRVQEFQSRGQPVISVDTKKKELVGDYANKGQEWQPKGQAEGVQVHDFGKEKAAPYGVYDLGRNEGWVSVGTDHDTAEFAVETIRRWWRKMGRGIYPQARQLLITADGGGSNGSRVRLWKVKLQELADESNLEIHVCHFPPGTSKWNKIEHRMFCHITQNWRGRPLISHEIIVNLIGQTTTSEGLKIRAEIDRGKYPKGVEVSVEAMKNLALERDEFHGEWNYSLKPHAQ
jgi:hypothetical protein